MTLTLELIKKFESCRLTAYYATKQEEKENILTIGYGVTSYLLPTLKVGDVITQKQADEMVEKIIDKLENKIVLAVEKPLNGYELAAVTSLVYNIGWGNFLKSTLLKKLKKGDKIGAADEFLKWCKQNGETLTGLITRRKKEREVFLS